MKFAMQPMEEEMEKGKRNLTSKAEELADSVNEKFKNMHGNLGTVESENNYRRISDIEKSQSLIDYEKLYKIFLRALTDCKMKIDKEGFIRFIDDRLMEVI